jgi:hypothetical protein
VSLDTTAKTMTVKSRVAYQEAILDPKHFKGGDRVWIVWSGVHDSSDAVRQVRGAETGRKIDENLVLPAELVSTEAVIRKYLGRPAHAACRSSRYSFYEAACLVVPVARGSAAFPDTRPVSARRPDEAKVCRARTGHHHSRSPNSFCLAVIQRGDSPFYARSWWHVCAGAREDPKEEQRSLMDGSRKAATRIRALAPPA